MKISVKTISIFLVYLLLVGVPFVDAGEWKKKPFKDSNGNDVYEFVEDGYKIDVSKDPFPNVYGQDEYKIKDNEGNTGVFKRKPFKDANGNPVYEDTFTGKKQPEKEVVEWPNQGQEGEGSESPTLEETLLSSGRYFLPGDPETQRNPLRDLNRSLQEFQMKQKIDYQEKQQKLANQLSMYKALRDAGYTSEEAHAAVLKNEFPEGIAPETTESYDDSGFIPDNKSDEQ